MALTLRHTALTLTALTALIAAPALAEEGSFTDAQKAEIGSIIRDYILENPGIIFEAADKHRATQEEEAQKQAAVKIEEHLPYLHSAAVPSTGNPDGDVTIVEFFDYNCGYCKKALPDIQALVEEDKNIRVVFMDLPILGPTSRTAALWALAAKEQGKYFEYHVALMSHNGAKEDAELEKIAKDVGLDVAKMKKFIASPEAEAALTKSMEISRDIGVNGTPAFIVDKTFIPGYVGEDGLKQAISENRGGDKNGG